MLFIAVKVSGGGHIVKPFLWASCSRVSQKLVTVEEAVEGMDKMSNSKLLRVDDTNSPKKTQGHNKN